ncbi:MAG: TlpA disulfide reductase family protein [Thiomicrospira sp.]|nr:TlpA disulfide reductase family protein [Thiomicrospira sp.]
MRIWFLCLGLMFGSAYADSFDVPLADGQALQVTHYAQPDADFRLLWLHSQYDELLDWEADLLAQFQQQGFDVWASDILESLFLTRTSSSLRALDGEAVAALLHAAQMQSEQDGKGFILLASDRMASLALKGIREWQAAHLGETSAFKGTVLIYPNLYATTPLAGESPDWEPIVTGLQSPLMILQPEQGVHRWYLAELSRQLGQQGAPVYSWVLPQVKDYFFNPFDAKMTHAERNITDKLPQIIRLSAQRLSAVASAYQPKQLAAIKPIDDIKADVEQGLPRLHAFQTPKSAPSLQGVTFEGEALDLADLRGKVVLVNFWATWCPPCVTEIPSMNRLLAKYRQQGLDILSVDFQQSAQEIAEFVKTIPVDYPIMLDEDGRLSKQWGVFSFPTTFVVDRQGYIRYSLNQGVEWDVPELEAPLRALLNERIN